MTANHVCATCFKKYDCNQCNGIKSEQPCIFLKNDPYNHVMQTFQYGKLYFCCVECFIDFPSLIQTVTNFINMTNYVQVKLKILIMTCESEEQFEAESDKLMADIRDKFTMFKPS